jgi:DNA-binding Lrp family transcriptional regulator
MDVSYKSCEGFNLFSYHPKITARELSNMIGITERAVRNIIADLEQGGYIKDEGGEACEV